MIPRDPNTLAAAVPVRIRVHATAINRADTLQRKGRYNPPPGSTDILGLEAAGVVVKAGAGVADGPTTAVGARVMTLLPGGGYAEYVAVDARLAMRVPDGFSFAQAAAVPETWLTAFQLLHFVAFAGLERAQGGPAGGPGLPVPVVDVDAGDPAGLRAAHTVLIHAGGSGVGTAAVQLVAKGKGATALVTAGTDAKIAKAVELGATAGFNRKAEGGWGPAVVAHTEGAGVDVVLDCVGGSYWEQNCDALKTEGRWVLYGLLGGAAVDGNILLRLLRKRARLEATTLRARAPWYKAALTAAFARHALPRFASGDYAPIVDRVFAEGLDGAAAAHAYMETNANIGKIVLQVAENA